MKIIPMEADYSWNDALFTKWHYLFPEHN